MPTLRRKSRRPPVAFFSSLIASLLDQPRRSVGERESLRFYFQKNPSKRSDRAVEFGVLRLLHVGEQASHPAGHVLLEERALRVRRYRKARRRKARHDLAKRRRVILGFEMVRHPLDTKRGEIVAQARQRSFVEKAGQIIGRIGQQLAAAETYEQIEIFALDFGCNSSRCGVSKSCVRAAKWRRIAVQLRDL